MNKNLSRKISMLKLSAKKHSPEICLGLGLIGTAVGTILACKATRKLDEILERKETIVEKIDNEVAKNSPDYTQEDGEKDKAVTQLETIGLVIKAFAPAVIVTGVSYAAIINGHRILKKRNVALMAAYATLDKKFKDYRSRVAERFGEEVESQINRGVKVIKDENGNEVVQEPVKSESNEDYSRFFDKFSHYYSDDHDENVIFLKAQERYANDLLISKGYLFLNDVYDTLGLERTKAGQVVGWIYDPENGEGDNYVSFGLHANKDFLEGNNDVALLDFNVQGVIWDKIK